MPLTNLGEGNYGGENLATGISGGLQGLLNAYKMKMGMDASAENNRIKKSRIEAQSKRNQQIDELKNEQLKLRETIANRRDYEAERQADVLKSYVRDPYGYLMMKAELAKQGIDINQYLGINKKPGYIPTGNSGGVSGEVPNRPGYFSNYGTDVNSIFNFLKDKLKGRKLDLPVKSKSKTNEKIDQYF